MKDELGGGVSIASTAKTAIGLPDTSETVRLKRIGFVLSVSDLLWIPQAGLIAWAAGTLLAYQIDPSGHQAAPDALTYSLAAACGVVSIAFLRVFLQNMASKASRLVARQIKRRARVDLLKSATACSPAAGFPASGSFAAHITDQVDLLGPFYQNYTPQLMRLKIVPIAIVVASACVSWLAALILLVSGPIIPVFMALIGTRAKAASADQQAELTRLSGTLLDRIKGLETLTLFGALERTKKDIQLSGEKFRVGTMRVLKVAFLSSTVLELFSALGIAFCAVYVGFSLLGEIRVGTWGAPLGYQAGLFVLLLAPEFFAPLRAFATAYHDRAAGLAAQEKLSSLLADIRSGETLTTDGEVARSESAKTKQSCLFALPPVIQFEKVSVKLSQHQIFKEFNLEIQSGETLLLTGGSGSGKTTLLDCILGFHVPEKGSIRIDGRPIREIAAPLRQNVIWLSQSPRLFHGGLKANLLKGVSDTATISEEDIWTALKLAGAAGLVRRLPQGLATPLGEDGFGLSVGEIRRVALARAAMRTDATIVLADEPTAGLDEETAADVVSGLRQLCIGRTAMIATHDRAVLTLAHRQMDLSTSNTLAAREIVI
ncbi:MAG: thiol reductant ABC exporter subunit CydD [Roseibium sp.]|uniref:thiol reductant ABC exporter subunit CydD n=1 Tax=Roseibium sp. TaxID=1936156 RepID=UPI002602F022|nr:thiol reductant ABC exporter subunit CydD [Roseibium sp.]MCV0428800.1 thiol reductant ABC exporter subunit CydD [Roseibium sp.]